MSRDSINSVIYICNDLFNFIIIKILMKDIHYFYQFTMYLNFLDNRII